MNILRQFQYDLAARLAADDRFQYVPVLQEAPRGTAGGELIFESAVQAACKGEVLKGGKMGLCCLVFCAETKPLSNQNAGLQSELSITVRIIENTALNTGANGTGIAAEDLMLDAMLILQRFAPCKGRCVTVGSGGKVALKDEPDLWAWEFDVMMTASAAARAACALPEITASGAFDLLVTCATSGAAIYYTINGDLPTPASGTLYAGAVDVESGTFRAVAYKSGLLASNVAEVLR